MTRWKDFDVEVTADLVPRYFWTTASINVYLNDQCVLRTGGVLRTKGTQTTSFRHENKNHALKLNWKSALLGMSFPYQLSIDGTPVVTAKVRPRNWPVVIIAVVAAGIAAHFLLVL